MAEDISDKVDHFIHGGAYTPGSNPDGEIPASELYKTPHQYEYHPDQHEEALWTIEDGTIESVVQKRENERPVLVKIVSSKDPSNFQEVEAMRYNMEDNSGLVYVIMEEVYISPIKG